MPGSPSLFINITYTVSTPVFEGPFDLLLHLIERDELDISTLSLARITDQYLGYIHSIHLKNPEEVSTFIIIAAKLIQIKSESLLPRPPVREPGEEDPGEALAQQLRIYKRFKELALFMANREALNLHTYPRLAPSPRSKSKGLMLDFSLEELAIAARLILSREDERANLDDIVSSPRYTIRQKIQVIASYFRMRNQAAFNELFPKNAARLEIVVTFLALLELIKRRIVFVQQDQLFGNIEIEATGPWDENLTFELEFGE